MSYNYDPKQGGIKNDQGKLRLELVPPESVLAIGRILTHGCAKYGDRQWEKGMPLERIYGAAQRHLQAWAAGAEIDPDSGLPHLEHALCNLAMMVTLRSRSPVREEKMGAERQEQGIRSHRDLTEAEWQEMREKWQKMKEKRQSHPREDLVEEFKQWLQDNDGVPS